MRYAIANAPYEVQENRKYLFLCVRRSHWLKNSIIKVRSLVN
ncbi:hypothetical protein [Tolypothrix tenuis]